MQVFMDNQDTKQVQSSPPPVFGQYLIDLGVIDASALLEALIEQKKQREPLLSYLRPHFSAEILLEVAPQFDEDGMQSLNHLQERGLIAEADAEMILRKWRQSAPPLGSLLASAGHISRGDVVHHLAEFHESLDKAPAAVTVDPGQQQAPMTRVIPKETVQDPLPEPNEIISDQVILQEFFIVFDDDEKVNLEQSLLDLESLGADQRRGALDNLYRQYHSAKGSAGFINALILSRLLHRLEDCLSLAKTHAEEASAGELSQLIDLQIKGLDLIWQQRDLLQGGELEPVDLVPEIQEHLKLIHLWSQELVDRIKSEGPDESIEDLF